MYTLAYKRQVIPPTPIIDPTAFGISGAQDPLQTRIENNGFTHINGIYNKHSSSSIFGFDIYNQEDNYQEGVEGLTTITKYTIKKFAEYIQYNKTEAESSTILSVNAFYIYNEENEEYEEIQFNENDIIWVLEANAFGGPPSEWQIINNIYYKFGESPIGSYTKSNFKIVYTDENNMEQIYEYINMDDPNFNLEFTNIYGNDYGYNQLPNTITAYYPVE